MVEYQEHSKNMENLNIIIEINEDGEMTNFDIALRNTELPYKNTDEYEYVVEEFEKVKEVNHKKFRCLLARELNCFACTAIYRFQLIFVRRKRKNPPIIEFVSEVRNRIQPQIAIASNPTTIAIRQQQQPQQQQQQPIIKVVPKVVTPIVQNNVKTFTQAIATPQRYTTVTQQQINMQKVEASRLRQMLEKRGTQPVVQQQQQRTQIVSAITKTPTNIRQNVMQRRTQTQIVPDVGSSEEDIETEVIDSSMVEVQMETNSNSPQPSKIGKTVGAQKQPLSKVVVKREPNVTVESVKSQIQSTIPAQTTTTTTPATKKLDDGNMRNTDTNTFKCDLCNKEFHSLRQRDRHRVTHVEKVVHTCKTCLKTFMTKDALTTHEKTHTKKSETISTKQSNLTATQKRNAKAASNKSQSDESQESHEESIVEEETVHDDNVIYMETAN